ncbi:MAG: glycosyl transferase [Actinobacteria bacterium]|nr:glycosyl transferase [Actinomycetota bacterium]
MAPPLAEVAAALGPDVFVVDTLTMAGAFAADLLGVPWVELSPQYLYDPAPSVPPVGLGARPPRTPLGRLDQARLRRRQEESLAEGRALRDRMRGRIGLPPGGEPVRRLLATLPGLEYPRDPWPEETFVVGPLVWEPSDWPRLDPPRGEGPVVAVTDSTASTVDQSLVAHTLDGLASSDLRVVATTPQDITGNVPDRLVIGRGSHAALVQQASVFVCPGGHGTIVKALAAGCPVVVAPIQGDQRETARRVNLAGAGVTVRWGPLFAVRLASAVRRVLRDDRHRRAAARLARGAAGLGPDRAARLIEAVMAARDPAGLSGRDR